MIALPDAKGTLCLNEGWKGKCGNLELYMLAKASYRTYPSALLSLPELNLIVGAEKNV
jgi:hypothetical protein